MGGIHRDSLVTMHNFSICVYDNQGNAGKSQQLYEACLEREVPVYGRDHPITLRTRSNLALALAFCKTFRRRNELNSRAKEPLEFCFGPAKSCAW